MKVLVTGATGPLGREVCRQLADLGHQVTALARRRSAALGPDISFAAADVRDPEAVRVAMTDCEAVVHLAWVVAPLKTESATEDINLGGTRNVLDGMAATGCRRLVFSSSVLAYGAVPGHPPRLREADERRPEATHLYASHKKRAEDMITDRGVNAVLIRSGIIAGRDVDNTIFRFFSSPALPVPDPEREQQFVHSEDVARFTATAVTHRLRGPVNLAGEGTLTMREIASLMGRKVVRVPESALRRGIQATWAAGVSELAPSEIGALLHMPIVDTTSMSTQWGFQCAWSSREAIEDMARATHGVVALGKTTLALPWRAPVGRVPVRTALLRPTYRSEVRRLDRDVARVVGSDPGTDAGKAARARLLSDLSDHAATLARIGVHHGFPTALTDQADTVSRTAKEASHL